LILRQSKKLNLFYLKELEANRSKMTEIKTTFKNTMEEIVELRARLLAEAYSCSYDKIEMSAGFYSAGFDEWVYDVVKDSSIYHIIYMYDGEIGYLGFNKNFETQYKYGYISEEEYLELMED